MFDDYETSSYILIYIKVEPNAKQEISKIVFLGQRPRPSPKVHIRILHKNFSLEHSILIDISMHSCIVGMLHLCSSLPVVLTAHTILLLNSKLLRKLLHAVY